MKSPMEYREEILKSVQFLLSKRFFDRDTDNEELFEELYRRNRRFGLNDFVVHIKDSYYCYINIWSSENDLKLVADNVNNLDYVRKDGIGVLEDTIVGNIPEFLESLDGICLDYHYMNLVDENLGNVNKDCIISCLTN